MKKFLISLGLMVAAALSFGQVSSQSVTTTVSDKISILYLRDGLNSDYKAISYKLWTVPGLNDRLAISAIGAIQNGGTQNVYTGTGLTYTVYERAGWKFEVIGGLKGFQLNDEFRWQTGRDSVVFGFGLSIPIVSK